MGRHPQHLIPIQMDDGLAVQIYISRYTVSGITLMYGISRIDVISRSADITWLRRAIIRLREHSYHEANGTDPPIPYTTLHEREDALLGLVFIPE